MDELYADVYGDSNVWRAGVAKSIETTSCASDAVTLAGSGLMDEQWKMNVAVEIDECNLDVVQGQGQGMKRAKWAGGFVGYAGELLHEVRGGGAQPLAKKARTGGFLSRFRGREEAV